MTHHIQEETHHETYCHYSGYSATPSAAPLRHSHTSPSSQTPTPVLSDFAWKGSEGEIFPGGLTIDLKDEKIQISLLMNVKTKGAHQWFEWKNL